MPYSRTARGRINLRQPLTNHAINKGLVAWWLSMPSQYGGTIWPSLVGVNIGTLAGMTAAGTNGWKPSTRLGSFGSLLFNGSTANVPINATFNVKPPLTISVWIYPISISNNPVIFANSSSSASNAWDIRIGSGTNGFQFTKINSSTITSDVLATLNAWQHVVWTCAAPHGPQLLYVNGALAFTGTDTNSFQAGQRNNCIGAEWTGNGSGVNGNYYTGYQDDLRIYNRVLTATEIQLIYNLSQQGYPGVLNRLAA